MAIVRHLFLIFNSTLMICIMGEGRSCSTFAYTNDFTNTSFNLLNDHVFFISCFQAMLYVIYLLWCPMEFCGFGLAYTSSSIWYKIEIIHSKYWPLFVILNNNS
jgi:hypothetical protein